MAAAAAKAAAATANNDADATKAVATQGESAVEKLTHYVLTHHRSLVVTVFGLSGCFAEAEVVPAAALDALAPLACGRADFGEKPRLHVGVRKLLRRSGATAVACMFFCEAT